MENLNTVGNLNAGSISPGFGTINNGTSGITTHGILTATTIKTVNGGEWSSSGELLGIKNIRDLPAKATQSDIFPQEPNDIVNKKYVDQFNTGIQFYMNCPAASTDIQSVSQSSNNELLLEDGVGGFSSENNTYTVDGVTFNINGWSFDGIDTVSSNKRVLIKNGVKVGAGGDTNNILNGIYTVGNLEESTLKLTRASDFNEMENIDGSLVKRNVNGAFVPIENGTQNRGTIYYVVAAPNEDNKVLVDTNEILWSEFHSTPNYSPGVNIKIDANTISLKDTLTLAGGIVSTGSNGIQTEKVTVQDILIANKSISNLESITGLGNEPVKSRFTPSKDHDIVNKEYTDDMIKYAMPPGSIIMWSGQSIPQGWYLCDGNNNDPINGISIPDLRGRFIFGANKVEDIAQIGGSSTISLTKANLPPHKHTGKTSIPNESAGRSHTHYLKENEIGGSYTGITFNSSVHYTNAPQEGFNFNTPEFQSSVKEANTSHTHNFEINDDNHTPTPVDISPPYYTLAYIIKTF